MGLAARAEVLQLACGRDPSGDANRRNWKAAAAILLPILHHVRLWRELAHKERMKAADVGQPMHQEDPAKLDKQFLYNSYWIAFWLGGGFPIAAVGAAAWITSAGHLQHLGYLLAVWCSVAAANMTSVICAVIVIRGSRARRP